MLLHWAVFLAGLRACLAVHTTTVVGVVVYCGVQVLGLAWVLATSPQHLLLGPLAHLLLTLLPTATNLNLVVPALSLELALDSLLAWAVASHTAAALLPWLLLNILAALGLTSEPFSPHIVLRMQPSQSQ